MRFFSRRGSGLASVGVATLTAGEWDLAGVVYRVACPSSPVGVWAGSPTPAPLPVYVFLGGGKKKKTLFWGRVFLGGPGDVVCVCFCGH